MVPGLGERSRACLAPPRFVTALFRYRVVGVRRGGFDRRRGRSSVRFFRGWLRGWHRMPGLTSSGYNRDKNRILQGSGLRSKAARQIRLRLREEVDALDAVALQRDLARVQSVSVLRVRGVCRHVFPPRVPARLGGDRGTIRWNITLFSRRERRFSRRKPGRKPRVLFF